MSLFKEERWTPFHKKLQAADLSLTREKITTLQINLGKRCNQACQHCHVEAGPLRTEMMSRETIDKLLGLLAKSESIEQVDITGGAPELHPDFRYLVRGAKALGAHLIDRCNLTVLFERGQEETAAFLAEHQVEVTASLPCYQPENVEKQRGKGVFQKSIDGLRLLNELGYGHPGSGLALNLVYNPLRATLPPAQNVLEADYKVRLKADFGIVFNQLFTITNMPIKRYLHMLKREGNY